MSKPLRTISLWQPWASLIALGEKHYETRHWSTDVRSVIAIHAAKRWTAEEARLCQQPYFRDALSRAYGSAFVQAMPLGAVLCIAHLVDVYPITTKFMATLSAQERAFGSYAPGRWAWEIKVLKVFDPPIPAKGAQNWWPWTPPEGALDT